jgi:two-component system response regulator
MVKADRKLRVLQVEDNPGDVRITRLAFEQVYPGATLDVVPDGHCAMDYLYRRGEYQLLEGQPLPDLVLLDLNLPRMDGREVLAAIRGDKRLCTLPVIMFTTSDASTDVINAYRGGSNSYVQKPFLFEDLVKAIQALRSFWAETSVLPGDTRFKP